MIRKTIIWLLLCLSLWLGGLDWFIRQIPTEQLPGDQHADAIVVLTGGAGRLEYGLQLLSAQQAARLFVSGVSDGVTRTDLLHYATPEVRNKLAAMPQDNIAIGHKAVNTIGNASETAAWLRDNHYSSILLVTSSYHMPRSTLEFEEVSPGLIIIPAPVFPADFTLGNWATDTHSRMLMLSEYNKFLASKVRHWFVFLTRRP